MTPPLLQSSRRSRARWVHLAALASATFAPFGAQAARPDALWNVVHDLCVTDGKLTGLAAPCLKVDLAAGYAIVPDPRAPAHLLLAPTERITGIEDPKVLEVGTPNYWRQAWSARSVLEKRVGAEVPRDAVGLAINAKSTRSQDQMHIHISCIKSALAASLKMLEPVLTEEWSEHEILGRGWSVMTLAGDDLAEANPFRLVAASGPGVAATMDRQTILVVGAQLADGPGFYILRRAAEHPDDRANAESMLDEKCAFAAPTARLKGHQGAALGPRFFSTPRAS